MIVEIYKFVPCILNVGDHGAHACVMLTMHPCHITAAMTSIDMRLLKETEDFTVQKIFCCLVCTNLWCSTSILQQSMFVSTSYDSNSISCILCVTRQQTTLCTLLFFASSGIHLRTVVIASVMCSGCIISHQSTHPNPAARGPKAVLQ